MSQKKKKARRSCLGEFVWVVEGKTQHPARLLVPRNKLQTSLIRHSEVEIMWTNSGIYEWVDHEEIIYEEDEERKQPEDGQDRSSRLRTRKQKMIENEFSPKRLSSKRSTPGPSARKRGPVEDEEETRSAKKRPKKTEAESVDLVPPAIVDKCLENKAFQYKLSGLYESKLSRLVEYLTDNSSDTTGIIGSISSASKNVVSGALDFLGLSDLRRPRRIE